MLPASLDPGVMASSRRVQSGPLKNTSTFTRGAPTTPTQSVSQWSTSAHKSTEHKSDSTLSGRAASLSTTAPVSADFILTEKYGDLFSCPDTASLAHCVSADLAMGKGIAKLFKAKFCGVDDLKSQRVKTGGVAVLKREKRFIYYLVTKPRSFHKPTYDTLRSSLLATRKHCVANSVSQLCMPMIGCGLDQLDWDTVKSIITETFADVKISIAVYKI